MTRLFITFLVLMAVVGLRSAAADSEEGFDAEAFTADEDRSLEAAELFRADHKPRLPDLVVDEIMGPLYEGGTFKMRVFVRNSGHANSASNKLLLSDVQNGHLQTRQLPVLAPNQHLSYTFNVSAPENQGPWYFQAIVDYGNVVREMSETNNVRTLYKN